MTQAGQNGISSGSIGRVSEKNAAGTPKKETQDSKGGANEPSVASRLQTAGEWVSGTRARLTNGVSPKAWALACADWSTHLAGSLSKQVQLAGRALSGGAKLARYGVASAVGLSAAPPVTPPASDKRFTAPGWQRWPYNVLQQAHLLTEAWWRDATTNVPGVSKHHEHMVSFMARQVTDALSPTNFLVTNPEALERTVNERGRNLVRGAKNLAGDAKRSITREKAPETAPFEVGRDVAVTPGKVVLRTRVMELIQYAPTTATVQAEPIFIVPAWIMKYYILDLSPHDSLAKYLVAQGHTVFMISWKNPGADDRDLGMDDYVRDGVVAALDAITTIVPGQKVHATGYCLGGTILSIAAAAMARDGDDRLKSVSLFAAQVDFRDAGEITVFIDEHQLATLDDSMRARGYLDAGQMGGAFMALRAGDLIWSRAVRRYLFGEADSLNDIMAWNADATRMPYKMHSRYLHQLYLRNELAEGKYELFGRPVLLGDIRVPIFAVGTEQDHVAPWRSVFKLQRLTQGDLTFVLTSGGHNAGIVSEPGHKGRRYRMMTRKPGDSYTDPEAWVRAAPLTDGSWWVAWHEWITRQSQEGAAPPALGAPGFQPIVDAPGTYVHVR
jgi:polyhydroxyalkanoate synthase subunit PhaC